MLSPIKDKMTEKLGRIIDIID